MKQVCWMSQPFLSQTPLNRSEPKSPQSVPVHRNPCLLASQACTLKAMEILFASHKSILVQLTSLVLGPKIIATNKIAFCVSPRRAHKTCARNVTKPLRRQKNKTDAMHVTKQVRRQNKTDATNVTKQLRRHYKTDATNVAKHMDVKMDHRTDAREKIPNTLDVRLDHKTNA